MIRPRYVALWWIPLLIGLAPFADLMPAPRDIADFFVPIRDMTASSLSAGVIPWLNLANGCGEAWFANPETAVLYPPAWLHLVLPMPWAMTFEIVLHLAWLALGAGLLARALGAGPVGRMVTEVAAWSVGPVVFTIGVLNNLETLAWVPWMVLAGRRAGRWTIVLVAATTALAWLGGEPQIWAFAVVAAVAAGRFSRQVVVGVGLGVLLVAAQAVPFLVWVLEGDRGPQAAEWALRGAVTPAAWSGLLVPGMAADSTHLIYMESLFFGAPLLLCGLLGAWQRKWMLAAAACFCVLATIPELGGGQLLLTLTGGLVRFPSRFALMGLALLLPMVGVGAGLWIEGRGRPLAAVLSVVALILCGVGSNPLRWWVAGIPAALLLLGAALPGRRWMRAVALVAGLMGAVAAAVPLLGLQPSARINEDMDIWLEAEDGGRIYAPTPSAETLPWMSTGLRARRLWPAGYLNLMDGTVLARTDSPVANRHLAEHVRMTDRGPERRWWLDTLAARWVILRESAGIPEGMEEVRVRNGMRLLMNRQAVGVIHFDEAPPQGETPPGPGAGVATVEPDGNEVRARVDATRPGFVWVSLAPVRGWSWRLNGELVELSRGQGIVQFVSVGRGEHELAGTYRPPWLAPSAIISLVAALALAGAAWQNRRRTP